eukprot:Clim_evm2s11 gene=Clim_evmTU2s11
MSNYTRSEAIKLLVEHGFDEVIASVAYDVEGTYDRALARLRGDPRPQDLIDFSKPLPGSSSAKSSQIPNPFVENEYLTEYQKTQKKYEEERRLREQKEKEEADRYQREWEEQQRRYELEQQAYNYGSSMRSNRKNRDDHWSAADQAISKIVGESNENLFKEDPAWVATPHTSASTSKGASTSAGRPSDMPPSYDTVMNESPPAYDGHRPEPEALTKEGRKASPRIPTPEAEEYEDTRPLFQLQQPIVVGFVEVVNSRCTQCFNPIRENELYKAVNELGKVYHWECYSRMHVKRCAYCGDPLIMKRNTRNSHNLPETGELICIGRDFSGEYGMYLGKPYHRECYEKFAGPRCAECFDVIIENPDKGFSGACYVDNSLGTRMFHLECWHKRVERNRWIKTV